MIKTTSTYQSVDQMVYETKFCLNCGKRLPRGHGYKIRRGYCNTSCHLEKPPKMAFVEQLYNQPIRKVIIDTLNRTTNVSVTAEILGISKLQFYKWLEKFNIKKHVEWR